MIRLITVVTILATVAGCQHKPLKVHGLMDVSGSVATSLKSDNTASRLSKVTITGNCRSKRKVAIIEVDGLMINKNISGTGSLGENPVALFREKLSAVACDPTIAAVVLRINSPGGGVTATDIMSHDLMQLKLRRNIPVVACNMVVAAGGAYYLSTHADAIVAHPTSIVGGIGVILNAYNLEDALGNAGIAAIPIKAGEMIDSLSPDRELEGEEREILQAMADNFHQRFISQVKHSRGEVIDTGHLFDGQIFTGQQAVELGLADQLGYIDDAVAMARELGGVDPDGGVVMFRRDNDRAHTMLDITPNDPLQSSLLDIKIPGLDRSSMPMFLYLWQADPSLGAAIDG